MEKHNLQEIEKLINYLSKHQDPILKKWEDQILQGTGKASELASASRNKFRDDIPAFLDGYYKSLKNQEQSLEDIGRKHGAERWEYGLNLQQTMQEWKVLHQVLADEINTSQQNIDLDTDVLKSAQKILTNHIHEGILYSVKEFDKLKNSETEAQLLDLQDALKETDDISRNHNLRSTSHDLKGIMQNLQMGFFLIKDEELGDRASELIDQMSSAADSLEQLLNDLLDLFRLETHREEINVAEFDAAQVLEELGNSMQPMAEAEELDLEFKGTGTIQVRSDKQKLQRVARNLVLNALKYTQSGLVKISWEEASNHQWTLTVSDTGPGLSVTHAKALTTEADDSDTVESVEQEEIPATDGQVPKEVESHGEGIGLLIVRHLCKLLDAIIKVETKEGEGTTFEITFPKELSLE